MSDVLTSCGPQPLPADAALCGHTAEHFAEVALMLEPRGRLWVKSPLLVRSALYRAFGGLLSAFEQRLCDLFTESLACGATELLPEWEEVYGTRAGGCSLPGQTSTEYRQARVCAARQALSVTTLADLQTLLRAATGCDTLTVTQYTPHEQSAFGQALGQAGQSAFGTTIINAGDSAFGQQVTGIPGRVSTATQPTVSAQTNAIADAAASTFGAAVAEVAWSVFSSGVDLSTTPAFERLPQGLCVRGLRPPAPSVSVYENPIEDPTSSVFGNSVDTPTDSAFAQDQRVLCERTPEVVDVITCLMNKHTPAHLEWRFCD